MEFYVKINEKFFKKDIILENKKGVQIMIKKKSETFEWVKSFMVAIVLVRTFFFSPIVVDGHSMDPTLQDKDRMVVTKIGEPKRFDIIVFHAPDGRDYIKRVIGLPGDSIEYKNDVLYINGKAYNEPYLEKYKKGWNFNILFHFKGDRCGN
jgi:signal peptidase I